MVTHSRKRVRRYRVARSARSAAGASSGGPVGTSSAAGTKRAEPGEKSPSDGYWHMTARYTTVISEATTSLTGNATYTQPARGDEREVTIDEDPAC